MLPRLNPEQFSKFSEFIYRTSGIRIDDNKLTLLSNRVRRRVQLGGFEDFDSYYRFLTSTRGQQELAGFLDAITTNETSFFRTPKQFEWLAKDWLDEQIARQRATRQNSELRIWSAGCSCGAEPYSMAICIDENRFRLRDLTVHILGTDISQENIDLAIAGRFKPRLVEKIGEKRLQRYFQHHPDQDSYEIRRSIREMVEFEQHNLMHPMARNRFDLIFIRNVLIYFDAQSKRTVINHLIQALAPNGYLVVGPSEGIFGLLNQLERVTPLVYKKTDGKISLEAGS